MKIWRIEARAADDVVTTGGEGALNHGEGRRMAASLPIEVFAGFGPVFLRGIKGEADATHQVSVDPDLVVPQRGVAAAERHQFRYRHGVGSLSA